MISKVVAGSHFNLWLSLALVLLLVFVILTAVHLYYSNTESYKLGLQLPGPPPIPLLGNALMAIRLSGHGEYEHFTSFRIRFSIIFRESRNLFGGTALGQYVRSRGQRISRIQSARLPLRPQGRRIDIEQQKAFD